MTEKLRVWQAHPVKHGYRPSYVTKEFGEPAMLLIGMFDGPHCNTLAACDEECQRRNREQIDAARKALIAAQVHWNNTKTFFNIPF